MKRTAHLLLVILILAIVATACAPAAPATSNAPAVPTLEATSTPVPATEPPTNTPAPTETATPAPIVLKDGAGTEFTIEKPAEKIISLAPSNTEILFAIGAGKQVIAREDFSNYPKEAESVPSIGGSMGKYNLEDMVKLQPDLILASPLTADADLQSLKTVTPNVFVLPNPTDLEGMYQNLVMVGELTGHKADAEKLVQDLRARAKAVLDKVATAAGKPKVFYELDATEPAKPWTSGPGTFVDLLITLAGGQNIGGSLSGAWAQISQEELIVQNPDVILLGDALYGGITAESVAARPGWKDIQAVKDNRVLPFNDDLVSRPGPRMIDGLEALAKAIHPELFK